MSLKDSRVKYQVIQDDFMYQGWYEAYKMSTGEYIMIMTSSDKYCDKMWVKNCIEVLENDREVSLVYANMSLMNEGGDIVK